MLLVVWELKDFEMDLVETVEIDKLYFIVTCQIIDIWDSCEDDCGFS